MTNEEMERAMEFLVQQQAQFSTDLQQVQRTLGKLTDATLGVVAMMGQLIQQHKEFAVQMAETQATTDEKLKELSEKGAETEERLNIFINVVERYISERHDGRDSTSPN